MNRPFNLLPVLWRRSLHSHLLIFHLLLLPLHLPLLHLMSLQNNFQPCLTNGRSSLPVCKLSYLEEISSPPLCLQLNQLILKLLFLTNLFWLQLPDLPVVAPVIVEASDKAKEVDSKSKKKAHKSRRDKSSDKTGKSDSYVSSAECSMEKKISVSEAKQKKRDRCRSLVSKTSRKHESSTSPWFLPAPDWSLLSNRFLLKGVLVTNLPLVLPKRWQVPLSRFLPKGHNRSRNRLLPVLVPVLTGPKKSPVPMNKFLTMIMMMMIGTGPENCRALVTDTCQILQRPQNKWRKCPTEKLSGQCAVIWVGITSPLLRPITLNRTSPTIPGRERTPASLHGYRLLYRQTTGCAGSIYQSAEIPIKMVLYAFIEARWTPQTRSYHV